MFRDTCDIGERMSGGRPSVVFSGVYDGNAKMRSQKRSVHTLIKNAWDALRQVVGEDPQTLFRVM